MKRRIDKVISPRSASVPAAKRNLGAQPWQVAGDVNGDGS